MRSRAQPSAPESRPAPRRRLSGDARAEAIVRAAAELFAAEGLGGSTRQIARRLGVTQALIYRFFPSKEALVDAVYTAVFRDRWDPAWDALLADPARPLEDRLVAFYTDYAARADATAVRLFVHAGLSGRNLPGARGARLTDRVFAPILAGLRAEAGLPPLAERPMLRGERELCMHLHGSVVFLGIRRHVYGLPMPDSLADVVALQVRCFVAGAPVALRALHAEPPAWPGLRVRQLSPPRGAT